MSLLQNSNAIQTAGGYDINNSLRLRSSASASLSRTFTNNNTSFTFSCWIKRGALNADQAIFGIDGSNFIEFTTANEIKLYAGSATSRVTSTALFRDPSAWYHIVIVRNGGQGGTTSAWTIYVNNQVVATYTGNGGTFTSAVAHTIGSRGAADYFDGYMTEINYVEGSALTPSSFGETDSTTGVWKPKAYTGTYGTNGFYLKFSDIATTSGSNAGLGKDFSGNGNYWTTNNISVTAGATYDAMTDSPTNTSATVSSFAVLNALDNDLSGAVIVDGNLKMTGKSGYTWARSTITLPTSGKYYFEAKPTVAGTAYQIGLASTSCNIATQLGTQSGTYLYDGGGSKYINGSSSAYGASYTNTDTIGVAFDASTGTLTLYKNNTSQGNLATGISGEYYFAVADDGSTNTYGWEVNFGQRPFTYTPPTDFVRLNTYNLPDSTIVKGNSYMDATLYAGNSGTQSVTNDGSFSSDLVWIKGRNGVGNHGFFDSVRGTSLRLASNLTDAEVSVSGVTSFNSNGFTLGATFNLSGVNYVAWQWDASSSTVTNTTGTISAQVRANTTAGFSIVTYTGTGANATVGHGLGVAPKMMLVKGRSNTDNWQVYHSNLTSATYRILLNSTAAETSQPAVWNSTAPTSSVFSLGTGTSVNQSAQTFVAYCWAEIEGFSKFGSYTGNGSTNGPFVYTGFRPKFVIIKNASTTTDWTTSDTSRNPNNVANLELNPNLSDAESTTSSTTSPFIDILSNGFKVRTTSGGNNGNTQTLIYMAFAENPFKNALAR